MRTLSERRATTAAAVVVGLATVGLFLVSRGKWSDALIDSGNVWIVPDTVARGGLLYRDIVWWFGPFTPSFHAPFLRLFGSGFPALMIAGLAASAATVAVLFAALRRVTSAGEAFGWTALAVPALFFMPDSGGAILGMGYRMWHAAAFGLASLALVPAGEGRRAGLRAFAAGALAGMAGLCRTEWGLVVLFAGMLAAARGGAASGRLRTAFLLVAGFAAAFGAGLGIFVLLAGPRAVLADGPVLLWNMPPETRTHLFGVTRRSWSGLAGMVYGAAVWAGAFLALELVALRRSDPLIARRRLAAIFVILAVLLACVLAFGFPANPLFAGGPLVCAGAVVAGLRLPPGPLAARLTGFGVAGLLLFHRRPFHVTDGAYVAPPLMFVLVCAAALATAAASRDRPEDRKRLSSAIVGGLAVLTLLAFGLRADQYAKDRRVPIRGTGGMLSAEPALAREIESLASTIRARTRPEDGLVIFPEGEVLNLLSDRRNPVRHKLYLPGYVTAGNEPEIVAELERSRPAAVVLWHRPLDGYEAGFFGADYARKIGAWIEENYERDPSPRPGRSFELRFRKERRTR